MLSYMAFIHHGIESAGSPLNDGKTLAQHCVRQLQKLNKELFPPRLLILLASPAYLDSLKAEQLLNGVLQTIADADKSYRNVELMGCSVAAVFFNRHIYHEGALLVCLASRLLKVKVAVSPDASHNPEEAVQCLLKELGLYTEAGKEIHSLAHRMFFTLFPGFGGNKYLAPELHELLRDQLKARASIFGGVASANDPRRLRSGILFANREIHRNALVAASVESGIPFGISLTQGLTDTGHTLNVDRLDPQDRRVIRHFREGSVREVMERLWKLSPVPLFTNLALDRDPTVDPPALEGETLRLTREVHQGEPFHILIPEPEKMRLTFREGVKQSLDQAWLLNPIAGLGFRCAGLLRHSDRIGLDLKYESALIERDLSVRDNSYEKPFVGGFVDGEASVDKNGKSVLGNWSNATLVFGDELRARTPVYRGFDKLADFAGMRVAEDYKEGINRLTQLVYDIGFPGAMLSFCLRDQNPSKIIAQSASGPRYEKLLGKLDPYPLDGDDILAVVVREKQARYVRDSRLEKCRSMVAASREDVGIISQYIVPLTGIRDDVHAVLQIDLGDISYDTHLYPTEVEVLDALGKIINSSLNRTFNWEESQIIRKLDQAMSACLSAETIRQGLQQYLEEVLLAFGLKKGHVRIAQEDKHCLSLVAGIGSYFEETKKERAKIDFLDVSPTAQAFRDGKIIIVNDPERNKLHKDMLTRVKGMKELHEELQAIGSYANIPFRSARGEQGTINLLASKAWFFTPFHESTLKVVGERVAFLLETLRRKQREFFLLGVSPLFSQIRDLNDVSTVLVNEVKRFADTVKAEVGSLYLWEEDRQRYILRALYGWSNPQWVNAAFYTPEDFWIGASAIAGVPRHVDNLFNYYKDRLGVELYPQKIHAYTRHAFGQELSRDFTVEAIALQLRIVDVRLGVLTLYRRIKPGDESGFVTTDTELLQQGADNFASLISILQTRRRENWENQEHKRRQMVYDVTILVDDDTQHFERRVCLQTLTSYEAVKTRFYKVDKNSEAVLRASFQYNPRTDQIEESAVPAEENELVTLTVQANRKNEKEVLTDREKLADDEWKDPQRVAVADAVRRACIPLFGEKQLVGLLDLHWSFDDRQAKWPDYKRNKTLLKVLGEVVGSAYYRSQTKQQAKVKIAEGEEKLDQSKTKLLESEEWSSMAIQITSAYVMQHQHELRNRVQEIGSTLRLLERAFSKGSNEKSKQLINELVKQEKDASETLQEMMDIGHRVINPATVRLTVKNLIHTVLKKERGRCQKYKIQVVVQDIADQLCVCVDPMLIVPALTNLVDNAINAISAKDEQGERVLTISAKPENDLEKVTIVIEDTGIGMTDDKRIKVEKGFFSDKGRISAGVPTTRFILWLFMGSLAYDSVQGKGTVTRITLPLTRKEENL